jgi:nucleoside-diphosphate-sugar epimerase
MANFLEPKVKRYAKIRDKRSWTTSMTAETEFPIVDHEDIAKFAVAAFQDPEKYHRRALGLASHQLKIQDMLDQLAEAAGQPSTIRAKFLTDEEVEVQAKASGFSNSHKALRLTSNYVNLKELAEIVPLTSFKDFLKREKDLMMKTFPTRAS